MEKDRNILREAFERHLGVLRASAEQIMPAVKAGAELLLDAVQSGRRLFTCGNGGSAADSQHFAAEFVCKYKDDRRPLPAIALTTDTSALTAIGNDYGFEEIFRRQVSALGSPGDVLVAMTTSGASKNVLLALDEAKKKKMKTMVLTGTRGAGLAKLVDCAIIVPSEETARIQEIHELVYHAWCEYIDAALR